jgi:hypothetical protein
VRSALALILALALLAIVMPSARAEPIAIPDVAISGPGLPEPVYLAPTDADAFRRRVNLPPRLDFVPQPGGPSYTVTTAYWNKAVDRESGEEDLLVAGAATYWPEGGYVLTSLAGEDVWLVLDLRQRALLDRYIRLGSTGAIGPREGNLHVLATANATEFIGIGAGVAPLTAGQRTAFWTAFGDTPVRFLDPLEPPESDRDGFWLLLTIPDGPGYEYYYNGATLTDSFGAERYSVSPALRSLLEGLTLSTPAIQNEDSPGSLLWWPVMLGGGVAAIGAAYWLNRRNQQRAQA